MSLLSLSLFLAAGHAAARVYTDDVNEQKKMFENFKVENDRQVRAQAARRRRADPRVPRARQQRQHDGHRGRPGVRPLLVYQNLYRGPFTSILFILL